MSPERAETSTTHRRSVLRSMAASATVLGTGCLEATTGDVTETVPATETGTEIAGTVRIAGSSTVYPLTLRVGELFTERYPDASISVTSTGTGGGFGDFFCVGETDINDASRPISASEREQCAENDVEFLAFRVGTDALTVIVNDDADWVDCVTPEELAAIWREDGADRWSDVRPDWPDEPIELLGPSPNSGTFDYFAEEILDDVDTHRQDYDGTEQDSTIIERVQESTLAIGYLGFAYYTRNDDRVTALAIDDGDQCVHPSLRTAKSGAYTPLSRPLFIYVATESLTRPVVRAFVRYYLEQVDTDIVSEVGYVPLDEATADENRSKLEAALPPNE